MKFVETLTGKMQSLENPNTFAKFYDNTHLNLFHYVMASCGGIEDLAEDITAEAYLRAWKNRRSFTGTADAAFGWVLTIARRLLIDKFRVASSHPVVNDMDEDIADGRPEPGAILVNREMTGQLIKALQCLPEDRREIVVMRYVLGWRVNQIADHLNIPENTISVTLRRSLQQLHKFLVMQGVSYEETV